MLLEISDGYENLSDLVVFGQIFIEYGARLFFVNTAAAASQQQSGGVTTATDAATAAVLAAAAEKSGMSTGGLNNSYGGAVYNDNIGWTVGAASHAEAAHTDRLMRSASGAGGYSRSGSETPLALASQLHCSHSRDSFRGGLLPIPWH